MKINYTIILFDLDGTLTDPAIGIIKSIQFALEKYHIFENDIDKLKNFIGPPLNISFQNYYEFSEKQSLDAISYYRIYYSEKGIYENNLYPDVEELLNDLQKFKKHIVLATSKPTIFAQKVLEYFNISQYFNKIIGSNLDTTMYDKTEIISYIMNEYKNYRNENVIMVGDREHDIIGAKNNSIDSIAVTYGYGSKEELINAGPTYIVKSIKELRSILL